MDRLGKHAHATTLAALIPIDYCPSAERLSERSLMALALIQLQPAVTLTNAQHTEHTKTRSRRVTQENACGGSRIQVTCLDVHLVNSIHTLTIHQDLQETSTA